MATRAPSWRQTVAAVVLAAVAGTLLPLVAAGSTRRSPAIAPALRVITEPTAGMGFLDRAIAAARHSVVVELYELADPSIESALIARARAHVTVEVLLDKDYDAGYVNEPAFALLHANHVAVHWADAGYIFHEKAVVVDGATAYVGTGNLTSKYYATTRDFWVVDTERPDVAAIAATFRSDWPGAAPGAAPSGTDLVWSPGAEATVVAMIDGARHSITLESEELDADPVVNALVAAAHRHVTVHVTMTYSSSWKPAFNALVAAGAAVHVDHGETPIYIHAKALCVDCVIGAHGTGLLLIGSHNLATYSLTRNRELSIRTRAASVVQPVAAVLRADFLAASRYTG